MASITVPVGALHCTGKPPDGRRLPIGRRGADGFSYLVTIQSERKTHTVRTTDGQVLPTLRPLIDYLVKEGRRQRGKKV